MMLANRTNLISDSATSKIRNIANNLKKQGLHVINFAAGELDFDTCEEIKIAAKKAIDSAKNQYTDTLGITELRKLISKNVSIQTGCEYDIENIGLTSGAKQALFNVTTVLFQEGDEVIIPLPYWETFSAQIKLSGATPIYLDTRTSSYEINIDSLKKLINQRTKGIIINTPNNPTSSVYRKETLIDIAKLSLNNNLWLIFDECYGKLVYDPHKHYNIVEVCKEIKEQAIIINSFSKIYSITGWRLGYFAASKNIVDAVKKFQGHTTSNPNSIVQYAILEALKNPNDYVNIVKSHLINRRYIIKSALDNMNEINYAEPQGTFYFYLNFEKIIGKKYKEITLTNAQDIAEILLEDYHVAITPGGAFNDSMSARISYAVSDEDIKIGLERIKLFINFIK